MKITKILTEYQDCPIGLDEAMPAFSWELDSTRQNVMQSAYQIQIWNEKNHKQVWDTEKIFSSKSSNILYGGEGLDACTRYKINLRVWDNVGIMAEGESWFETGLMNPHIEAWEGAQWIAAPRYTVMTRARGVFCIEATFKFCDGADRAGIVFGAEDYRLQDSSLNEYGLAGENYIRYEVNLEEESRPMLHIYRVGYAPEDSKDKPFAKVELGGPVERDKFHTLSVLVSGNQARAVLDGVLVDDGMATYELGGRVLNPRGSNDVLTYPRLNQIGFFAGDKGKVLFQNMTVSNVRAPGKTFIEERPIGNLYGEDSIFKGEIAVEEECFVLCANGQAGGIQVVADPSNTSIPMLRSEWKAREGIRQARLYITARGVYEVAINGNTITNSLLAPGLTQYDKRLNYQTYDVTELLKSGKNAIGVILSSGWWSDAQTFTVANYNYFGDKEALLCKLVTEYEDGSREVLVSGPREWKYYGQGPWQYAGFFMGEQYDGRLEDMGRKFSLPEFSASDWEMPIIYTPTPIEASNPGFARDWPKVNEKEPLLIGGYDAPVSVVEERNAQKRIVQSENVCVYDFEQEMAGVPEIVFHEKKGTRIYIRYGEMIYPNLPRYGNNVGRIMQENYRDAESTDVYICRGDEDGEVYRPRFTFHGFRYLELNGVTNFPELFEVKALQYSSITDFQGSFKCSNALLNRFVENVKWSQRCNFINIPTDCPQRNERMGWVGDTHVFCSTALHNSNLKLFYERNLQAMSDLQEENGRYPEIAPIGGGFGGITYECATIFMAWELYLQYGDIRTLKYFYPGMKRYMDYMKGMKMPGIGNAELVGPLADWLAFQETDSWLMWNAFYYRETTLMEKIAGVLQYEEDKAEYAALKEQIRHYWNNTFKAVCGGQTLTSDGRLCDTQTSYALALEYDVTDARDEMGRQLARKVRENGYKVGTGFFGTGLINKALSKAGYQEEAYNMLLQTEFPSWLYPVTQGATTIWEHWDSYTEEQGFGEYNSMNSFNHYSLGSVLSWMYDEILGIQRQEEYPGFTHFLLKPDIRILEYAYGSVASPLGKIESGWKREGEKIVYTCTIPVNSSATLMLPDGMARELGSGHYEFSL